MINVSPDFYPKLGFEHLRSPKGWQSVQLRVKHPYSYDLYVYIFLKCQVLWYKRYRNIVWVQVCLRYEGSLLYDYLG